MHKLYTHGTKPIVTVMNVVCVSMLTGSDAVYNIGNNNNIICDIGNNNEANSVYGYEVHVYHTTYVLVFLL